MKRALLTLAGVASIFVLTASQALAFDCFLPNKANGAGSVVTVDLDAGTETPSKPNPGTEEQPHGAFVSLTGTIPGTDIAVEEDVFIRPPLNAQAPALEEHPGVVPGAAAQEQKGGGCDGKGWDTLESCYFGD